MTLHEKYMSAALKEAEIAYDKEEIPVGCVIVFNDIIIAKAHNLVDTLKDPTAHAEILAITSASEYLSSKQLLGCTVYVTLEPCPMCAGAFVNSKIDSLYFGAFDKKSGACGSVIDISNNKSFNHKFPVYGGILDAQSSGLLKSFFEIRR